MISIIRRFLILLSLILCCTAAGFSEERFIIRIAPGVGDRLEDTFDVDASDETPEQLLERLGFDLIRPMGPRGDRAFIVSARAPVPASLIHGYRDTEPRIRSVEPVRRMRLPKTGSDAAAGEAWRRAHRFAADWTGPREAGTTSYYGAEVHASYVRQPATRALKLRRAHRMFGPGTGIVAIIDTGIDPEHPALRGSLVGGYDFTRQTTGLPSEWLDLDGSTAARLAQSTVAVVDGGAPVAVVNQSTVAVVDQAAAEILNDPAYHAFGHGTMVAGLVRLIAPAAKIMPLKAFRSDGTGDSADIVQAIYFAANAGVDVINMSFSFEDFSPELMRAINHATRRGVVCVSSAGNKGQSMLVYPASFNNVTGVAGTTATRALSPISNFGEDLVSISTFGEELQSTFPGNRYAVVFGTSFSTAIVSGSVALLEQMGRSLEQHSAELALAMGRPREGALGHGELNLLGALRWLRARAE